MPIKVLFIVNDLGLGGVQKLVIDFANYLNKDAFEVSVAILLSRSKSYFYREELNENVRFVNFSFGGFSNVRQWLKLYSFIKQNKFDIVFTQLFMADTIGRISAFLARTPVIITAIQNINPHISKKCVYTDKLLAYITDFCISPTEAITEYAANVIRFPARKIIEIPTNGVALKKFQIHVDKREILRPWNIPDDAKIVINVGRLTEQKGQSVLLRAAKRISEKNSGIYFLIVGSGELEEKLQQEAKEYGIEKNVKFLGARKDIPQLLMASDVFAFPSLWEGQGLVLFEAIFSKTPIVASDIAGIRDIIQQEETGILVQVGNPIDLAEGILKILNNRSLAEKLVNRAAERFCGRTLENSVNKIENLFKRSLSAYKAKKT